MIEGLIICGLAWLGIGVITDEYKTFKSKLNSHDKYKYGEELEKLEKKYKYGNMSHQGYKDMKSQLNYKYKQ